MTTTGKCVLSFIGGVITGAILTIGIYFLISKISDAKIDDAYTMYDEPTTEIKATQFEILQVLNNGDALATVDNWRDNNFGMVVLLLAEEGGPYYDEQIIDVPSNKRVMQIGTFEYISRIDMKKTVPVVVFMDK